MKLYQHGETGPMSWCEDHPGGGWAQVSTICRCELPECMEESKYDLWSKNSIATDDCVHGPLISFGVVH